MLGAGDHHDGYHEKTWSKFRLILARGFDSSLPEFNDNQIKLK